MVKTVEFCQQRNSNLEALPPIKTPMEQKKGKPFIMEINNAYQTIYLFPEPNVNENDERQILSYSNSYKGKENLQ